MASSKKKKAVDSPKNPEIIEKSSDYSKDLKVVKKNPQKTIQQPKLIKKIITLKRAWANWKMENPWKADLLGDYEVVKLFVKKFIPDLLTTQEEFNNILNKF